MTWIASTLKITVFRHRSASAHFSCACVHVCVGVSVFPYCPGTTLTLTTLPARPSAHFNHPAVVNYQGSIALTHKAQIWRLWVCVCACVRARACMTQLLMRYGCHLQALVSLQSSKTDHFHSLHAQINPHSTCRGLAAPRAQTKEVCNQLRLMMINVLGTIILQPAICNEPVYLY